MKMRELIITCSLLLSLSIYGINDNSRFESARSTALSNATVSTYGIQNPASTILFKNSFLSATYENKYITKELSSTTFTALYKAKFADLLFCMNYFGYEIFNETSLLISSSKELSEWLSFGINIQYNSFYFHSEDGRSNRLSAGFGFILFQNKNVNIGLNFGNLLKIRLDSNYDPLTISAPFNYQLGLAYHAMNDLSFLFQLSQWKDQNIQLAVATEYTGIKSLPLRFGISGMPFSPSFGLGYQWEHLQIDVAAKYYINLGFSPSFSLTYSF
ncbi:MAG: hypothetical protein ACRCZQ_06770 [Bacteroidales bacterium]